MDLKPPNGLPNTGSTSDGKTTARSLQEAVDAFSSHRVLAIGAIRRIQKTDPEGLALAAVKLLVSAKEKSPGLEYAVGLFSGGRFLASLLLNKQLLSMEAAVSVARKVTTVDALLDVHLIRHVVDNAAGKVGAIKNADALQLLGLVDAISNCSRLASYLVQFVNHPCEKVRSKAALMLGRSNWNMTRVEGLLASDDGRMRANAVESLWGHRQPNVQNILWKAAQDPCGRVMVNAILGLCLAGNREAHSRLTKLVDSSNPMLRSGAAWAMGETGDPEFEESLEKLAGDRDSKVRATAEKSRAKLRLPARPSPLPVNRPATDTNPATSPGSGSAARLAWLSGYKSQR
jgi:hypothetical protein